MKHRSIDNIAILTICIAFFGFAQVLGESRSALFGMFFLIFYGIVSINWDKRKELWFWYTIVPLALVEIVVIFASDAELPRGPAIVYIVPITFIDGFLVYWAVNLAEFIVKGRDK